MLHLQCSQIKTRDMHHLLHTYLLPITTTTVDGAELTRFLTRLTVLWLVDSWEEATPEAKCLLKELLETRSRSPTLLVTSRPEMSGILTGNTFPKKSFLKFSLLKMNHHEKEEFLKQNKPNQFDQGSGRAMEEFISYMAEFSADLQKELSNPLKLMLAAQLWCEDKSK